ncbi:angiopoietin-related protein 7-like [Amphibalanus amphitrite]|uniref:angiopoietin-related protein 7-like n=1 Tax=Amphibalanus amphitrite TaxID=1232801 RepID=UPI001C91C500|nr:angiopoietin-related protein 7-like [Amphibalanus amphitrite]
MFIAESVGHGTGPPDRMWRLWQRSAAPSSADVLPAPSRQSEGGSRGRWTTYCLSVRVTMSALSSRLATLLTLAVLIVTAGCDGGQSIPLDEYVQQLVQNELQSIVSTLQSGMERLENRLESRMEALEGRMEELTGRLDGQQTQLDEIVTQLNGQKSQQDETTATVNDLTERLSDIVINMEKHVSEMRKLATRLDSQQSQLNQQKSQQEETATTVNNLTAHLDTIVTQQGDQLNQTSQLATRINSQQSQLSELNTQLNEQKTTQSEVSVRMDNLTSQVDILRSKLTGAISNTSSQQERIDDLAAPVHQHHRIRDCSDLPVDSPSGVYLLRPSGNIRQPPVEAYCDMATAGGNWTVIQRRADIQPHQDFYLGWNDYKDGFGNVTKEFWWGLEHVYQLTSSGRRYELRIDLEAFDGNRSYATYQQFRISSEEDGYTLSCTDYSGTAGGGLRWNVNEKFSTRDRDQDGWSAVHCAQSRQGPWWYDSVCGGSSLNGRYRDGGKWDWTGIWWNTWRRGESLKKTDMKIRPTY